MNFTIRLLIWFKGKFVGNDSFGNRYYEEKKTKCTYGVCQPRRWVVFKSKYDASKIPPEWYAWLNYRADKPLNGQVFDLHNSCQRALGGGCKKNCGNAQVGMNDSKVVKLATKSKKTYRPWVPDE